MKIERFEDLKCWQKARLLAVSIYEITNNEKFTKDYGLKDQIRRAAVSISSNIAEGFERGGNKEFIQFLYVAKGSTGELRTELYIAKDLDYINEQDFDRLNELSIEITKICIGFISYLKQSNLKGQKFSAKEPDFLYTNSDPAL